ncbi:MAG: DUF3943 domain-containing protein [Rectinemataceae bacterium]
MPRPRLRRGYLLAFVISAALAQAEPQTAAAAAPSAAADIAQPAENPSPDHPRYGIALAEILGVNVVVNSFDRFIDEPFFPMKGENGWANSTLQSSWANLAGPWHFDQDPWLVNEIGHPIQGLFYFTAARSNGLDFWESALGTAIGSFTWKLFGEVDDSNINDLVTTTMGGVALGEMVHRLYVEAERDGSWARFFASPMDAANDAVFGERSREDGPSGFPDLSLSFQAGFVAPFLEPDAARTAAQGVSPGFGGLTDELGEEVSYGDPFGACSSPYDYFEQRLDLELSPSFWGIAFFSSGTLYTIPLVDTGRDELSLASCLHYDFIDNSFVELEANAVGLSLFGRRIYSNGFRFSGELHLDAIVLGTNENAYLREIDGVQSLDEEGRDYDWGFGEGAKIHLDVSQPRFGRLSLDYAVYGMNPVPGTADSLAPLDYAIVGVLTLAYEHMVSAHVSVGSAYALYHKNAFYDSLPEIQEYAQAVTFYVRLSS